jgi:Rhamnan synthesis protein F
VHETEKGALVKMANIIVAVALKFVAEITFLLATPHLKFSNWLNVRITKSPFRYRVEKDLPEGTLTEIECAIFAIYPRYGTIESSIRAIRALERNNIQVICVINESKLSNFFLERIQENSSKASVVLRKNFGRDFGAYQAGINYLESKRLAPSQLYFLNDSVIYTPEFEKTLSSIAKNQHADWACLFLNTEDFVHAQSFFLKFSIKITTHKDFIQFWKQYYPTFQRRKTIRYGEQELSQVLIRAGFYPEAYYSISSITDSFINSLTRSEKMVILQKDSLNRLKKWEEVSDFLKIRAADLFAYRNVTHFLGLPLTRLQGAPLKLDLLKNWSVKIPTIGILNALTDAGVPSDESKEIINSMIVNGTTSSFTSFGKLWSRHGLY